jgi:hypothetical protein
MINFILFAILFYRSQFFRHLVGIAFLSTMLWWYGHHQNTQTGVDPTSAAAVEQQEGPSIAAEAKVSCC